MKRDIGLELLTGIDAIKNGKAKRVTVNLPGDVKMAGQESWADEQETCVDFDPADYMGNPVALAKCFMIQYLLLFSFHFIHIDILPRGYHD